MSVDATEIVSKSYSTLGSAFGGFVVGFDHLFDIQMLAGVNDTTALSVLGFIFVTAAGLELWNTGKEIYDDL